MVISFPLRRFPGEKKLRRTAKVEILEGSEYSKERNVFLSQFLEKGVWVEYDWRSFS